MSEDKISMNHGAGGEVRCGACHDVHREGAVHRYVRRADHVHRDARPPAVQQVQFLVPAHRHHVGVDVPGQAHAAVRGADEHARGHQPVRLDRVRAGDDADAVFRDQHRA